MGNNGIVEQIIEIKQIYDANFDLGLKFEEIFKTNKFNVKNWNDITDEQFTVMFLDLGVSDRFLAKMFHVGESKVARCRERLHIGTWASEKKFFDYILHKRYEKVIDLDQFIKEISV